MNIWRINTRTQTLNIEPTPETWQHLGGRGLLARILVDEVPGLCEPLGAQNKLIFAPGLMVGHRLSSCDRISVGGKSPLTGGVKEANAGGTTGLALTYLNIKALILEDKPEDNQWQIIRLSTGGAQFEPAGELAGMGVFEAAPILIERYGKKVAIAMIGPGGEMELGAAGIQNLDKDGVPSRIAARGGLGALMGSKRIKAIVIDPSEGDKPAIANVPAFRVAQKAYTKSLMEQPQTITYRDYGTAAMANMANHFGSLPTRGFSEGQFEDVESISGEHMRDLLLKRGGESKTTHACMPGCSIQCSNVFGGEDGKTLVSPLEYETIGLMGANLGINDLDTIARLSWDVSDLGLDTIEVGAALGVAARAGLMEWGDGARAAELIAEIRAGTPLGRILGHGATSTGKVFGVEQIPAVKGQAMSAYDPRAIKGTGVTYATSPQGADHTCGLTIRAKVKHTDPAGQAALSRTTQINMAGYDTLGVCIFAGFGFAAAPETIAALLNARYGWEVSTDILQVLGRETLKLEREFNKGAGFTPADDRLPEWMTREAIAPTNAVFDVSEEDLDGVFNW
ncbi:MAG TPA: aldehyde ferredoxin oxidoreductase C-terminal domain-containing protein [Anaerolineales bacterium]|nr:aldehyde ferredoxin oxidoreductase C-terminal domain-containing protein [Anaerolineales bacterium]